MTCGGGARSKVRESSLQKAGMNRLEEGEAKKDLESWDGRKSHF